MALVSFILRKQSMRRWKKTILSNLVRSQNNGSPIPTSDEHQPPQTATGNPALMFMTGLCASEQQMALRVGTTDGMDLFPGYTRIFGFWCRPETRVFMWMRQVWGKQIEQNKRQRVVWSFPLRGKIFRFLNANDLIWRFLVIFQRIVQGFN